MQRNIIIEVMKSRTRLVVTEEGQICEYASEYDDNRGEIGNIYRGRVSNLARNMQAAFVDIGLDKNAFMFLSSHDKSVKVGDDVLVQVEKEPPGKQKGLRVTRNILLSGQYLILDTAKKSIGISKKIIDGELREHLRTLLGHDDERRFGFIVRTAAQNMPDECLIEQAAYLQLEWDRIKTEASFKSSPGLVYTQEEMALRMLRDLTTDEMRIVIDDKGMHDKVKSVHPKLAAVTEYYSGQLPLFDAFALESKLDALLSRKVNLKSGAYLVMDFCEAMSVIDVNSGKHTKSDSLEETALCVNLEAASEIARQLRLRDIGGIIAIDFIDMEKHENRDQVMHHFREALGADRSQTVVHDISPFGICEMTRKRLGREHRQVEMEACGACGGTGLKLTAKCIAYDILVELRRRVWAGQEGCYVIAASKEVLNALRLLDEVIPIPQIYAHAKAVHGDKKFSLEICVPSQIPQGAYVLMNQELILL